MRAFCDLLPLAMTRVSPSHRQKPSPLVQTASSISDDNSPPRVFECGSGRRPEHVEGFRDPGEICLALSLCSVWYAWVFWCHREEASSGSTRPLKLEICARER